MKVTFALIKQIYMTLSVSTSFGAFIVTTLCTNPKSPKFIEYTELPKSFLNFYISLLFILMLCDSINPKMVCKIFSDRIGIITSGKGKIVLISVITTMYFSTDNMPQKLFGMISFVTVFGMFLAELFLNCEILNQKPLIFERIDNNHQIKVSGTPEMISIPNNNENSNSNGEINDNNMKQNNLENSENKN